MPDGDRPTDGATRREPLLAIHASERGDVYVVCLRGEFSLRESLDLELALILAESSHAGRILLDLGS